MLKYLNHDSVLKCVHQGTVTFLPPPPRSLVIQGSPVLTESDLLNASIVGCTQTGPGVKPCLKISEILIGKSKQILVDRQVPLLEHLQALTDGSPPGFCSKFDNSNSNLQIGRVLLDSPQARALLAARQNAAPFCELCPQTPADVPVAAFAAHSAAVGATAPSQSEVKSLLIVRVNQDTGAGQGIPAVAVSINGAEPQIQQTNTGGQAVFNVSAGSYTVSALKDSYLPEPAQIQVEVPADSSVAATLVLELVEYHMHLDADRDGRVDDDYAGLDLWEWGPGKKGAVVLCNNDDDDHRTPSRSDNEDAEVNGGNDADELAPIVFRRLGPPAPPTWEAFLEIDPADVDKIRIFEGRAARTREVIGPGTGHRYRFSHLDFTEQEFGMEALRYAGTGFDGEITLTFSVKTGTGKVSPPERARVRVAPWMMPNHLDPAETVYVVDDGRSNERFRRELRDYVAAAGCNLQEHPSQDIWMQDCMEWGYSSLPTGTGFRTVIRAPRDRPLQYFPETLRKPDIGYHPVGRPDGSTVNSFGNLEVSPPVISKAGKKYPWGRIYYGSSRPADLLNLDLENFLTNQLVQEPIPIDTGWLAVAHVDEIISFVPSNGTRKFKLLLASPKLAYKILDENEARHPSAKLLTGRRILDATWEDLEVTIKEFLANGLTSLNPQFDGAYLKAYNNILQGKLELIQEQLETELGLTPDDIIQVPVIFADISVPGLADALTAGMVNMLVINGHCIFPQPYGPVVNGNDLFQVYFEDKLRLEGLTPHAIDDWYEYHLNMGEVHCGTSVLRMPNTAKWWEFEL